MATNTITAALDPSSAQLLFNQSGQISKNTKLSVSKNNVSGTKTEAQIRSSAQGFERILLRQMLSTMRNPVLRGGSSSKTPSSGYLETADDHLAELLSQGKGMGFGSKMAEQLLKQANVKQLIANEQNAVKDKGVVNAGVASKATVAASTPVSATSQISTAR
jgi:Rod binding domain-containing protein